MRIKESKRLIETIITEYISDDGKHFKTERECVAYENLRDAIKKEFVKIQTKPEAAGLMNIDGQKHYYDAHSEINCTVDALMSALVKECTTVFEKVVTPWNSDIPLPENILEKLLFDCEFNPDELEYLSRSEILNAILEYEGIIGYTDKIIDLVCDIWHIEL